MKMKKLFIILIIASVSIGTYAQSCKRGNNPNKENKFVVKTNLLGMFTLFYEHPIAQKMSFQVGLQYNPKNLPKKDIFVTSIAPELRYYFLQTGAMPGGLFAGIYTKYQYMSVFNAEKSANIQAFAGGLNLGFQYIFKNGLTTEIFAGGGYNFWKKIKTDYPETFPSANYKFDIRIGLGLGYAF